ncbi:MAG: hypothetical protein E6I84_03415, partial [Chloroflexi bacterium]
MRRKAGQTIVLMALTSTLMMGGIGIAVDLVVGYLYSIAAERAAAAAALSGVVFMPTQFSGSQSIPTGSRNDATDRAVDEAKRNGFDVADTQHGVVVVPSSVLGHPNQLRVTVGELTPVFFMQLFGFRAYLVQRTAVATYLPPISLGQPGSQIGSSLGELGRVRFSFPREEGWAVDRGEGDAYTPNPLGSSAGPSVDVHQMSFANQTVPIDTTVADRGGYDYRITIPSNGPGGVIQVYDAASAPDGIGPSANYCDNSNHNPAARTCSAGGNNWLHEDDQGLPSF